MRLHLEYESLAVGGDNDEIGFISHLTAFAFNKQLTRA